MVSPLCEVKDGAGAYSTTIGGVDVTPANTITIRLIDQSGVDSWSITCATTDDLSVAATVTAGLTIDSLAKTATFTAPATGRAYRFQSRVNGGVDKNGIAQSTYTTTFCVYTLTGGLRVHALDETTEAGDFGWCEDVNTLIRNTPAVLGAGVADFLATPTSANLATAVTDETGSGALVFGTSPAIASPTISGTPTITATSLSYTGNTRCKTYQEIASVTTADATVTTLASWTITDEAVSFVACEVVAVQTDGSNTAAYVRKVRIKRDGGTVTVDTPEETYTSEEAAFATCDVTIDNSGSTGRVRVTGVAATNIQWGCVLSRIELTHA